jgi:hypothetical protein
LLSRFIHRLLASVFITINQFQRLEYDEQVHRTSWV